MMVKKKKYFLLAALEIFVALGSIPAGLSLMLQPDGNGIGLDQTALMTTPFANFFIPGVFLCFVIGLPNFVGSILSFRKSKGTAPVGIALGLILMTWIFVQVYFLGLVHFLQPLFFLVGLLQLVTARRIQIRDRLAGLVD